jgi:hypothetical protein
MNPVDWDNEFSHAMNIIYRLKNMRIIKEASFGSGYGRQCYLHQLIDEITRIMRHYKGKAVDLRGNPTKQVHDGLGSPDCIHVFLARRYGCDKIATFDHDFEESRPDIVPLLLYKEY